MGFVASALGSPFSVMSNPSRPPEPRPHVYKAPLWCTLAKCWAPPAICLIAAYPCAIFGPEPRAVMPPLSMTMELPRALRLGDASSAASLTSVRQAS